jgi:hypothetical protein
VSSALLAALIYQNTKRAKSLDELARVGNVAQFVSYSPGANEPQQKFSRVAGFDANHAFSSLAESLRCLHERRPEGTINLRSFTPDSPRSCDFHYGLADLAQIENAGAEGVR